mmetsp:Transcript_20627/g.47649  ORF Transcript_20627/g.47649 Transcript_20627/m.47649 type:complete len:178 (-) Transcript_20627:318-851(-)
MSFLSDTTMQTILAAGAAAAPVPLSNTATITVAPVGNAVPFTFRPAVVARIPRAKNQPMGSSFAPGKYDVICGLRGKKSLSHVGNRRFRVTVAMNAEKYLKAPTKLEKSLVVIQIVDTIRDGGGHFVKYDRKTQSWVEIGDQLAREKVGHALRDIISNLKSMDESQRSQSLLDLIGA